MDWTVVDHSRIARLPKLVQPFALVARNLASSLNSLAPVRYHHKQDGIASRHNDGFIREPAFARAYARGVKAAGWDYQIPYRIHQALWCSHQAQKVGGDFVELGTGRGFIMSAVLEAFPGWNSESRSAHLFDTFSPIMTDERGDQEGCEISPLYARSYAEVVDNFSEWSNVHLHRGNVYETLPIVDMKTVAFLHIDLNFHEPEIFGLRRLWPLIPRGGVVLLDDYAFVGRERQFEAMNGIAAELGFAILSTPTGQGIIIK